MKAHPKKCGLRREMLFEIQYAKAQERRPKRISHTVNPE
jgi:hypothetical protein